ncbi:MAG: type II toxin-antitoxin system PemK/MazF family toxin, partial [Candidatus Poribacteria bacterium]|nr:type II toxin-antitoxin system PemK/MazF family toxin [Candidatus Poribacteria bacterium]
VVVCALTSNLKRASAPGSAQLFTGEANLPKSSVVNGSQLFTVNKSDLIEKIGTLSPSRMRQALGGIDIVLQPREVN